jgi:hypothetical protein
MLSAALRLAALATLIVLIALTPGSSSAPTCAEDDPCWQPALMGNGVGHVSPFNPFPSLTTEEHPAR